MSQSLDSAEGRQAISVIRALVVSRKESTTAKDLLKEYKELENDVIPFKKFGFFNLEEFLNASGEFKISKHMGEIIISAKPKKETEHITKMVKLQKSSSKNASNRKPTSSGKNWNRSAYTNIQPKMHQTNNRPIISRINVLNGNHSMNNNNPSFNNNNLNINNNNNNNNNNNKYKNVKPGVTQHSNNSSNNNISSNKLKPIKIEKTDLRNRLNRFTNIEIMTNQESPIPKETDNNPILTASDLRLKLNDKIEKRYDEKKPNKNDENFQQIKKNVSNLNSISFIDKNKIKNVHSVENYQYSNANNISSVMWQKNTDFTDKIPNRPILGSTSIYIKSKTSNENKLNLSFTITNPINNRLTRTTSSEDTKSILKESPSSSNNFNNNRLNQSSINELPNVPNNLPLVLVGKRTLQDRITINQKQSLSITIQTNKVGRSVSDPAANDNRNKAIITETEQPQTNKITKESSEVHRNINHNEKSETIRELETLCQKNGFKLPEFKSWKLKNTGRYHCRVMVNDATYSSYPDDFLTEKGAQIATAKSALEHLKREEERVKYPLCMESDSAISIQLYNILLNCRHGQFCKNIEKLFQESLQKTLPAHWFSIIRHYRNYFTIQETVEGRIIIFANNLDEEITNSETTSNERSVRNKVNDNSIQLPWNEKYWNLYITNPVSTDEIWVRIVGDDFSAKMDSLITDIELAMLTDKVRTMSITIGQTYLLSVNECWYRIRVDEMDFDQNICLCFFIDAGDEDWYPMDQLYVCDQIYQGLPAQGFLISLYGLEDFAENPNAKSDLEEMLAGKILIGEILTKQEDYDQIRLDASNCFEPKIKVVLYDTTSDEDISLNPLILKSICENTLPPQLERTSLTQVNVTHIADNGDIYVQLKNSNIFYIEKLIHNLVESKFNINNEFQLNIDMIKSIVKNEQLFFIYDVKDNKWYRAQLNEIISDSDMKMFYIDYGKTRIVDMKNMYPLDKISAALNKFPAQSLKVRLYGIQIINENVIGRLKGILDGDGEGIVKIMSNINLIPHVNIYIRLETNNILVCVNETIRFEQELENSADYLPIIKKSRSQQSLSSSPNDSRRNSSVSNSTCQSPIDDLTGQVKILNISRSKMSLCQQPKSDLPKLINFELKETDEFFHVRVIMASNPHYFVVQPHSNSRELHQLMQDLQIHCLNSAEFIPNDCIEIGQAYAALHTDGHWYRVTVENIYSSMLIHVCYCDFGDVAVLSSDKLKILPYNFRHLPKQAIKAKLHGIKPKYVDWTMDDCMYFQKLTVNQCFVSIINRLLFDEEFNNERMVEVTLIDVQSSKDLVIRDLLIDEGRAVALE